MDGQGSRSRRLAVLVCFALTMSLGGMAAEASSGYGGDSCNQAKGFYTQTQAAHGRTLFDKHCSTCHGFHLEGGAGPALSGVKFESSLEYSKISAQQLYGFISTQMPYNNPGSLSDAQYLAALSYIFKVNGYPSGNAPLTKSRLGCLTLLPYPGSGKKSGGVTREALRRRR